MTFQHKTHMDTPLVMNFLTHLNKLLHVFNFYTIVCTHTSRRGGTICKYSHLLKSDSTVHKILTPLHSALKMHQFGR